MKKTPTKKPSPKQAALATRAASALSVDGVQRTLDSSLNMLATFVTGDLAPPVLAGTFVVLKDTEKALKDIHTNLRNRLTELISNEGTRTTDKGSMRLEVDGWSLEMRPQKTGLDSKKVEALLRTKGVDVESGMDATVTYKANETKLTELVRLKRLSPDELETCHFDLSYALQEPRRVSEIDG